MLLFFIIDTKLIVLECFSIIEVLRYQYIVSFPLLRIFQSFYSLLLHSMARNDGSKRYLTHSSAERSVKKSCRI